MGRKEHGREMAVEGEEMAVEGEERTGRSNTWKRNNVNVNVMPSHNKLQKKIFKKYFALHFYFPLATSKEAVAEFWVWRCRATQSIWEQKLEARIP